MIITAEISHYPLAQEYESFIIAFIDSLKNVDGVDVWTHAMSTFVKGESNLVFEAIDKAICSSPEQAASTVIKIVNRDLPVESGLLNF